MYFLTFHSFFTHPSNSTPSGYHQIVPYIYKSGFAHLVHLFIFLDSTVDRYAFIAILLFIFFKFFSLLKEDPLIFHVILVWWWWNLLAFSCFSSLGSSLYVILFWMIALLGSVVLVVGPGFSFLWILVANPYWPAKFLLRSHLSELQELPCR